MNSSLYSKWILLVLANSIAGFILGNKIEAHWIGMTGGIITWIAIYISSDIYLIRMGKLKASKRLALSTAIRAPLQITVVPDLIAGSLALSTCQGIGISSNDNKIIVSYLLALFTGAYLSCLCLIIYVIISIMARLFPKNKQKESADLN
jgi:hypothetical protein